MVRWRNYFLKFGRDKRAPIDTGRAAFEKMEHSQNKIYHLLKEREKPPHNPTETASIGYMLDCFCTPNISPKFFRARMENALKDYKKTTQHLIDNPRKIEHHYEWEQFLDYVDWHGNEKMRGSHSISIEALEFSATASFAEAMHLARHGWDGLADLLTRTPVTEMPKFNTVADFSVRFNVAGGAINIGRYLAGLPDCMHGIALPRHLARPQKVQKILLSFDMNYTHSATTLATVGLETYKIAESLEMANIRTEIILHVRTTSKTFLPPKNHYITGIYDVYVTLKRADQPLHFNRHMFAIAHPSFLRRLVLSEMERNAPDIIRQFGFLKKYGYGFPSHLNDVDLAHIPDTLYIQASELVKRSAQHAYHDALYSKIYNILNQYDAR